MLKEIIHNHLSGEKLFNPWDEQVKHDGTFVHDGTIHYDGKWPQINAKSFQLESEVADIFRKTGAKVEQKKFTADQGIDLIVEWRTQDGQIQKWAVEVKSYDKPVDANVISRFAARVQHFQEEEDIEQFIVVANNGFTEQARSEAQKLDIKLFEIDELNSAVKEKFSFKNQIVKETKKLSKHILRSAPLTVSEDEFREVFGLGKYLQPLEYIHNEFEERGEVIVDHATGLMWQQSRSQNRYSYGNAKDYVADLNRRKFTGYDNWRLPTIPELMSLLEPQKQSNGLYINPIFDKEQWWCWSADIRQEKDEGSAQSAWPVSFTGGYVDWYNFRSDVYVRCVRSGQ